MVALVALVIAAMSLGPVGTILLLSFDVSRNGETFRLGLDAWATLFTDRSAWDAFWLSFLLALRVPIGLCIALVTVWLIVRVKVPGHRFFEFMFWFAFFLPTVPLLAGWILLLDPDFGALNRLILLAGYFGLVN